jgi:adenylate kinase
MNIVLIGPQGSGKSTQGKLISDDFGMPYISTGDMFREIMTGTDEFSISIKKMMDEGALIDDETTNKIVRQHLERGKYYKGFVVDGYPRSVNQSMSAPFVLDLILHIQVPEDISIERLLKRGRWDDNEVNIRKRLSLYNQETAPIIEYWRKHDKVVDIDGVGGVDEIHQLIYEKITNLINGN